MTISAPATNSSAAAAPVSHTTRQRSGRGVDDLILSVWRQAMVTPDEDELIVQRFGTALAASSFGQCLSQEMSRRNLPWNSCERPADILDAEAHTGND